MISILIYHAPTHTIIFHMIFVSRFNMFCVSFQFSWPLIHLTQQLHMHFCSSILGVCHFYHRVVRKATKILTPICVNTWQGTGRHYKKNITIGFLEIFKDDTRSYSTSINTIASRIGTCLCRRICSSNTCIGPLHSHGPGLKLCWIYIRIGWYYKWMFETCLI
jgi:hypothetical protein